MSDCKCCGGRCNPSKGVHCERCGGDKIEDFYNTLPVCENGVHPRDEREMRGDSQDMEDNRYFDVN